MHRDPLTGWKRIGLYILIGLALGWALGVTVLLTR